VVTPPLKVEVPVLVNSVHVFFVNSVCFSKCTDDLLLNDALRVACVISLLECVLHNLARVNFGIHLDTSFLYWPPQVFLPLLIGGVSLTRSSPNSKSFISTVVDEMILDHSYQPLPSTLTI
jgi:hypothetical protein